MPNRLINEASPYLRQHADDPVDWYPWGPEAFERAKREDKPILLSIGYAACHWCHVMERESFEDPETARIMNEHFINIKVDREERPDIDAIYMEAVQAMTGQGGWPLTVFLTPEGVPFYGGTYFPPTDRHGLPSFKRVLLAVAEAYRTRKDEIQDLVAQTRAYLQAHPAPATVDLGPALLDQALETLAQQFDPVSGGFGGAPKFPQATVLEFLLRSDHRTGRPAVRQMLTLTLDHMARGGLYDQVGGGFHRYAVDARWLVPHFEKMLYDNAQLAAVYLLAHQVTGQPFYRQIAEETLAFVARELTSPEGVFYASLDADSEGEEGKFYVWSAAEFDAVLGPDLAPLARRYFGVTDHGNFEGRNVLHVATDLATLSQEFGLPPEEVAARLQQARARLFAAREQRVRPARDEKVIAAWNGLMIRALATSAWILDRPADARQATRAAEFLWSHLWDGQRLWHYWKDGAARVNGFLDDYACLAEGFLTLYAATFDLRWFSAARTLADRLIALFWDDEHGGFFDTSHDHEPLIARPRTLYDAATPCGNSAAAMVLLRLAELTGHDDYRRRAEATLRLVAAALPRHPTAFGWFLSALDFLLGPPLEVAIIGDPAASDTRALLAVLRQRYRPTTVWACAAPDDQAARTAIPLLADRPPLDGRATAYVCRQFACQAPTTDPAVLAAQLD